MFSELAMFFLKTQNVEMMLSVDPWAVSDGSQKKLCLKGKFGNFDLRTRILLPIEECAGV
jgi:hypothetical protein